MNRIAIAVACVAAILSLITLFRRPTEATGGDDLLLRLEERLDTLEPGAASASSADETRAVARLEEIDQRLAALEAGLHRVPAAESPVEPNDAEEVVAPSVTSAEEDDAYTEAPEPGTREELEALMAAIIQGDYDWSASAEELERFYELARSTNMITEAIEELEAVVDANPADLAARMDLADFYVANLMTLSGPEQGIWGAKAERQWREVANRDGEHWRAHFSLGNNYAYYPDVMGKTDEAIHYLEEARQIQERSSQGSQHVQTYLSLARMHQRNGDMDRARQVLRDGLAIHAPNDKLEEALGALSD